MKILLSTTIVLGVMCILESNQPANAILSENITANIHLARGRGGDRVVEGRQFDGRGSEERAAEGRAAAEGTAEGSGGAEGKAGDASTSTTKAHNDHIRRLDSATTAHDDALNSSKTNNDRSLNNLNRYNGYGWAGAYDCVGSTDPNCGIQVVTPPTTTN